MVDTDMRIFLSIIKLWYWSWNHSMTGKPD